jgi:hypothetical protein
MKNAPVVSSAPLLAHLRPFTAIHASNGRLSATFAAATPCVSNFAGCFRMSEQAL